MSRRKYSPGYVPARNAQEAAERDARAQYWMNQRKIERVADAAARHGWYMMDEESYASYVDAGYVVGDYLGIPGDGIYRVEGEHLRKIESFHAEA